INTGLAGDLDVLAVQLLAFGGSGSQLLGSSLFQFGAAGFESRHVFRGHALGLALRDQEVAGVAILDLDHVAEAAEVNHFFHQNNLHGFVSSAYWCRSVYGSRARKRARLMAVPS